MDRSMSLGTYQALIAEMSQRTGVPQMEADDGGYLALTIEGVTLHLQYDEEQQEVAVFARLGEVEDDRTEAIYGMLLGANLLWQGTRGGTLAVEPNGGAAFLMDRRALPLLRVEALVAWIKGFHEIAAYWAARLATANEGGSTEASPDVEPGGDPVVVSPSGNGTHWPALSSFIRG